MSDTHTLKKKKYIGLYYYYYYYYYLLSKYIFCEGVFEMFMSSFNWNELQVSMYGIISK